MREFPNEESVFEELLSCSDENQRNAILEDRCGENIAFRVRMNSLLAAYFQSGYLEKSSTVASYLLNLPNQLKGKRVSNFEVLEGIGEGGMGDVYLGRSVEPPFDLVAIKVIKPGMDTRQVLSRFELERRTLQQLSHPNIARFVSSGMTESGSAFFAMELVRGSPITEYCDRHHLSLTERLRLFVKLCRAVAHANEEKIVHRDLKPSNVLVGQINSEATVKVIDFGVAKALSTDDDISSRFTGATQWIGTAQYMSPEQSQCSSDVDCRTDVYSLGCILFELIAKSTPVELAKTKALDLGSLRTAIATNVQTLPSRRLKSVPQSEIEAISSDRSTTPSKLMAEVSGKLDWIASKALAKDRSQRYRTAELLAQDVEAYLNGSTVSASAPAIISKSGRKTIGVAIGGLICLGACILISYMRSHGTPWSETLIAPSSGNMQIAGRDLPGNKKNESYRLLSEAAIAVETGFPEHARVFLDQLHGLSPKLPADNFIARYLLGRIPHPMREFTANTGKLVCSDLSSDCKLLAMGSFDGEIVVWDFETAAVKFQFRPSNLEITRVAFSPDSSVLAATGQGATVWLWDMQDGRQIGSMSNHINTISSLCWSPDGKILVSGDRRGQVSLWDTSTLACLRILQERQSADDAIRYVYWLQDGGILAILQREHGLILWDTKAWTKTLYPEGSDSLTIAESPNSRYLAFGGYGDGLNFIDLHNPSNEILVKTALLSRYGITTSLAFGSDNRIYRGTSIGVVETFDLFPETGNWESIGRSDLESKSSGILRIEHLKKEDTLLLGMEEPAACRLYASKNFSAYAPHHTDRHLLGTIPQLNRSFWWDETSQQIRIEDSNDSSEVASLRLRPVVRCPITYSEANGIVAIATYSNQNDPEGVNEVVLLRSDTWEVIRRLKSANSVANLSFSRFADSVAAGCEGDGGTRIWDTASGSFKDLKYAMISVTTRALFSPVNDILVVGEVGSDVVRCLDSKTLQEINQPFLQVPWATFDFHESGHLLILGDKRFTCLAPNLNQVEWILPHHSQKAILANLTLSFAIGSNSFVKFDGESVELWDWETHKPIITVSVPNQFSSNAEQPLDGRFKIFFTTPNTMFVCDSESNTMLELKGK